MPLDVLQSDLNAAVQTAAARDAEASDRSGSFPKSAFEALSNCGVTSRPPIAPEAAADLLWLLASAGRGDLSVGRILEGHINTLFLIERFGNDKQRSRYRRITEAGGLFGVWNTDHPADPLRLENGVLQGRKTFCTGIDGLDQALVTVEGEGGRDMILVPLDGLPVDRDWWRPLGMRASGSHVVDFSGMRVADDWRLGTAGDYVAQPWFSAGAMRFAAVQVGGMHGILDIALEHLRRTGRASDPYQTHRLAEMATLVEGGYGWLRRCASAWARAAREPGNDGVARETVATVNGARGAVEGAALTVLDLAERGVGAAGLIAPHPLERRLRDLRTYLRQPNPDGALAAFGAAVAAGDWRPGRRPGIGLTP